MAETMTEPVAAETSSGVVTADMIEEYADVYCDLTRAAGNDDPRVRRFVASTAVRDRYGDEIPLTAWDTKHYLKNPVMLWAHQYQTLPIGRAVGLEVTDKALLIDIKFTTADENPLGDQVLKLYDGGYMRAVSVGFRSKASEWIDPADEEEAKRLKKEPDIKPGRRFTKVELLELSAVPVPANPEALMQARKKGLVVPEARNFFYSFPPAAAPPPEQTTVAGVPGVEPARATEEPTRGAAETQHEGRAETGKDALAVSPPSPASGQPDAAALHCVADALKAIVDAIKTLWR